MDTFTLNKIAGAVLGTLLIVIGSMVISRMVYEPSDTTNGHGAEHAAAEGDGVSHDVALGDAMEEAEAMSAGVESLGARS